VYTADASSLDLEAEVGLQAWNLRASQRAHQQPVVDA
jgi:hypothetical protein